MLIISRAKDTKNTDLASGKKQSLSFNPLKTANFIEIPEQIMKKCRYLTVLLLFIAILDGVCQQYTHNGISLSGTWWLLNESKRQLTLTFRMDPAIYQVVKLSQSTMVLSYPSKNDPETQILLLYKID